MGNDKKSNSALLLLLWSLWSQRLWKVERAYFFFYFGVRCADGGGAIDGKSWVPGAFESVRRGMPVSRVLSEHGSTPGWPVTVLSIDAHFHRVYRLVYRPFNEISQQSIAVQKKTVYYLWIR